MKNIIAVTAVITVVMAIILITFSLVPLASASAVERTFDREGGVLYYADALPKDANAESKSISVYIRAKRFTLRVPRQGIPWTLSSRDPIMRMAIRNLDARTIRWKRASYGIQVA